MSSNIPSEPSVIPVSGEIRKPSGDVQLASGLYIVSTPIGNLRDITLRALDVLTNADEILAEDTRNARKLLTAYGMSVKLTPYHDHNGAARRPELLEKLRNGERLALISDAGTPLVSDPGWKLVRESLEADISVFPIPGASAMLAGLVVSGLPSDAFTFAGFLPGKSAARQKALRAILDAPGTMIFYETAARLQACLDDMRDIFGSSRQAAVARELTKLFEETRRGSLSDLAEHYRASGPPKGEIVIMVGPAGQSETPSEAEIDSALRSVLGDYPTKAAANRVASQFGLPKREVYERALSLKLEKDG